MEQNKNGTIVTDPMKDIRSELEKQILEMDKGFKSAIVTMDGTDGKQKIVAKVFKQGDWLTYHGIGDNYETARAKLIEAIEHKISVPY